MSSWWRDRVRREEDEARRFVVWQEAADRELARRLAPLIRDELIREDRRNVGYPVVKLPDGWTAKLVEPKDAA